MVYRKIQKILERWYISEPALFTIVCSHDIVENNSIKCPFRCGKGKIEYASNLLNNIPDMLLEMYLRAEALRILLKHPYERLPFGCRRESISIGSNLVLSDNYDFSNIGMEKAIDFDLPTNGSYEWYSIRIEGLIDRENRGQIDSENIVSDEDKDNSNHKVQSGNSQVVDDNGQQNKDNTSSASDLNDNGNSSNVYSGGGSQDFFELKLADGMVLKLPKQNQVSNSKENIDDKKISDDDKDNLPEHTSDINSSHPVENRNFKNQVSKVDVSELWDEDAFMACTIDTVIDSIESWGSIPANVVAQIVANTKARIDYRKTLSGFRASVLSTKRHLTRMRPNRRSGFDNMGSICRFDTKLLLAVDVSGSISDQTLSNFYSIINRFFKYGIEHVDVVQFDCALSEVKGFDKKFKRVTIQGRGGTNFQPIFDYTARHPEYDGLIIFTDGCAPQPNKSRSMKTKIVWVCDTIDNYNIHHSWMRLTGRCCPMEI